MSRRSCRRLQAVASLGVIVGLAVSLGVAPAYGQKALQRFLKKCERGDAEQCYYAGLNSSVRDPEGSRNAYSRACELGYRKGCVEVTKAARELGEEIPASLPEAVRLWRVACDQDYGPACTEVGIAVWNGDHGVDRNKQQAADLWQRACDRGSRVGCRRAGGLFERGDVVSRDASRALTLYEKSCDRGLESACADAGRLLASGVSASSGSASEASGQGAEQAAMRLRQACFAQKIDQRQGRACLQLGQMLADGRLGKKDLTAAFEAFRNGCRDDHAESCLAEGLSIARGEGVAADGFAAVQPLGKGCHLRSAEACREMCRLQCEQGQPAACTRSQRERWPYSRSCALP